MSLRITPLEQELVKPYWRKGSRSLVPIWRQAFADPSTGEMMICLHDHRTAAAAIKCRGALGLERHIREIYDLWPSPSPVLQQFAEMALI